MNVALPTLVVFALLLPGFVARSRIKLAERQSLDYAPFGQVVTQAVLWALALHLLWCALMAALTSATVRSDVALKLLSGDAGAQARALDVVGAQAGEILAYFTSLLAFAWLAPGGVRRLITRVRLDRVGSPCGTILRFSAAPWYYLLSGADFARDAQPDLISISAIVNVSGKPYLYTGILDDYFLDQDGRLDRLILQNVMRRPLERDKPEGCTEGRLARFYAVDGDYFVLRYAETVTLNVEYIRLPPHDDPTPDAPG